MLFQLKGEFANVNQNKDVNWRMAFQSRFGIVAQGVLQVSIRFKIKLLCCSWEILRLITKLIQLKDFYKSILIDLHILPRYGSCFSQRQFSQTLWLSRLIEQKKLLPTDIYHIFHSSLKIWHCLSFHCWKKQVYGFCSDCHSEFSLGTYPHWHCPLQENLRLCPSAENC